MMRSYAGARRMSESERTLVRQGPKQGRRPSVAEMRARIGVLETELASAHEREAATAEVLRQRTRELEESLEYQTATSDVLTVISRSAFALQAVLDTLVEAGQRLCDSDTAALSIREGDVFRFVATRSLDPAYDAVVRSQTFAPGRESVTSRLALTGEVVHIPDMTTDPYYRFNEAVTLGKLRTVLGVPLRRDSLVVGTLNLARQRVEPFTERQIELVQIGRASCRERV